MTTGCNMCDLQSDEHEIALQLVDLSEESHTFGQITLDINIKTLKHGVLTDGDQLELFDSCCLQLDTDGEEINIVRGEE